MFDVIKFGARNFVLFNEIEINFKKLGTNFIFINGQNCDVSGVGSNMSGKSLVGDLLTDLLFDNTIRKHRQESLIGKFEKDSFEFIILKDRLTKDKYVIKKFRNHPDYKNKVLFLKKNKAGTLDLSKKKKIDTYEVIWKTLGINWKTYKNSNFFGQDDRERFLDVTDSRKAEIIIDIQSLQDLQKCKELSRKEKKKEKKEEEILLESFKVKEESFIATEKSLALLKQEIEKEVQLTKEEIKECQKEGKILIKELSEIKEELSSLFPEKKSLEELELKIEKAKESFITVENEKRNLGQLGAKKNEIERNIKKLSFEISDKKKEMDKIKAAKQKFCRYCGSILDREKAQKVCHALSGEIDIREEKSGKLKEKCFILGKKISQQEQRIKSSGKLSGTKVLTELETKKKDLLQKILSVEKREDSFLLLKKNLEKVKEKEISLQQKNLDPFGKKTFLSVKARYEKEQTSIETTKNFLKIIAKKVRKNEFSEKVFDKAIRTIFDNFLYNLNAFSAKYLDDLCDDGIDLIFSSKVERKSKKVVDEISVAISVNGAEPRPFRTYCGGEKGRVELSTQLGLFSSTKSQIPFLFLDEPFHGVDLEGKRRMIDLLQKKANEGIMVAVISHEDIPITYGKILTVIREGNQSRIEET